MYIWQIDKMSVVVYIADSRLNIPQTITKWVHHASNNRWTCIINVIIWKWSSGKTRKITITCSTNDGNSNQPRIRKLLRNIDGPVIDGTIRLEYKHSAENYLQSSSRLWNSTPSFSQSRSQWFRVLSAGCYPHQWGRSTRELDLVQTKSQYLWFITFKKD